MKASLFYGNGDGHADTVVVVGSGAREDALVASLTQSERVQKVILCPPNENDPSLIPLIDGATFYISGPEAPLCAGFWDEVNAAGKKGLGPSRDAAKLEGSKMYAKHLMVKHGIPTPNALNFGKASEILPSAREKLESVVVKKNGLAGGKGVWLPREEDYDELVATLGDEDILIEERFKGEEVSLLAFCDGSTVALMPQAKDYKRRFDGDKGPNTGGMGAYAPASVLSDEEVETVRGWMETLVRETSFKGILYTGLMKTSEGVKVLEFNCRFGDPEAQALLPLLDTDLYEILLACEAGTLNTLTIEWKDDLKAVVIVLVEGSYPQKPPADAPAVPVDLSRVRHSKIYKGTVYPNQETGRWETRGGRVMSFVGLDTTFEDAKGRALDDVLSVISTSSGHLSSRTDIGPK